MTEGACWKPGFEERFLLDRLEKHARIYVGRPTGQEAAIELRRRGLLSVTLGDGADHGLLICSKPMGRFRPSGGGDVA